MAWDAMCYPTNEGGIGLRSLFDVSKDLFTKLWWNFRLGINSLWGTYMWNSYCKNDHPLLAKGKGGFHVWKK